MKKSDSVKRWIRCAGLLLAPVLLLCSGCTQMGSSGGETVQVGKEAQEEKTAPTEIQAGAVLTTETKQIVINGVELTYDVLPDDTSGFYTHYSAKQGKVYISVDLDVTNTAKQGLPCDEVLKITANYNGGYSYSGFLIVDDANLGFTYANITTIDPLETQGMKYLIECPEEVEETQNPLFLTIQMEGQEFRYTVR